MQPSPSTKDTAKQALRALAALVFVVAIVWVAMQSFRVLPSVRNLFANALVSVQSFFSPAEALTLSLVDSQVVVDEPFELTWDHRGKETEGSYTMSYSCNDDVYLARIQNGNESTIFCNTDVSLLSRDTKLSLVPHGNLDGVEEIDFFIRFTRNGTSVVSEEGHVTILVQDERFDTGIATSTTPAEEDDDNAVTTPTPTYNPTYIPTTPRPGTPTYTTYPVVTQPTSDPNGKADFTIRVIAIGLVDNNDGDFSERDEIPQDLPSGRRAAIKFVIENKGTKKTGDDWNFEVKLPTTPSFTYTSPSQPDLYPGDKVEYIIGFDRIVNKDKATYTIEIDPKNEVKESNEDNNDITKTIPVDRD
jgi:hypothetical protein